MNKKQLILSKIVDVYYPEGREEEAQGSTTIEILVEKCLAIASDGLYTCMPVNNHHYDYSDYSDSKTSSTQASNNEVEISVVSPHQEILKYGDLRVVVFNHITEDLDYYFLPRNFWVTELHRGDMHKDSIRDTYGKTTGYLGTWYPFSKSSFEELAKTPSSLYNVYKQTLTEHWAGSKGELIKHIKPRPELKIHTRKHTLESKGLLVESFGPGDIFQIIE
jgi:hypothetical protein